jgi:hypothetical protein
MDHPHTPREGLDPLVEQMLRSHLGPDSAQTPPPALRQAILERVAALPEPEAPLLGRPLVWLTALALAFLGVVAWWLVHLWPGAFLHQELISGLRGWGMQAESWASLLRSPLALSLLPLAFLPFFFHHLDEQ